MCRDCVIVPWYCVFMDSGSKNVSISVEAWRRLKQMALDAGCSVRSVVDALVMPPEGVAPVLNAPTVVAAEMIPPPLRKAARVAVSPAELQARQARVDAAVAANQALYGEMTPAQGRAALDARLAEIRQRMARTELLRSHDENAAEWTRPHDPKDEEEV